MIVSEFAHFFYLVDRVLLVSEISRLFIHVSAVAVIEIVGEGLPPGDEKILVFFSFLRYLSRLLDFFLLNVSARLLDPVGAEDLSL